MNRQTTLSRILWLTGMACCVAAGLLPFSAARADTCEAPVAGAPYELVFADEFDGGELDRDRWNTEFLWGPGVVINDERQYYVNDGQFDYDPFSVSEGVLSITAIKAPFRRDQLYLTRSIYGADSVELLWRVPARASRYEVRRDGELIGSARGGSYLDTGLRDGIDYGYEVTALDASGNALLSAQLTVNTDERPMSRPARPFSLDLAAHLYSSQSGEITWSPPNRGARFEVYRDGQLYRRLDGKDFSSLYEAGLTRGRSYTYRVISYDQCDEPIVEARVTLDTSAAPDPAPDAVARLVVQLAQYSTRSGEISWNAVRGARRYTVLSDGVQVQDSDARSFFASGLVPGVDRRYRVSAYDGDGALLDSTTRVINTADNSFARNRQAFLSGVMTSYDSLRFKYGRAEARMRMPKGEGLWGAFWLLNAYYNQDQPEDPEIDIIEALGDRPTTAFQAYHVRVDRDGDGRNDATDSVQLSATMADFSADFHTYRVDWSPGRIVWYIDDVETNRYEGEDVSSEQMYLIVNLAVGGEFPGPPDETTPFPSAVEIDWIRVYQQR